MQDTQRMSKGMCNNSVNIKQKQNEENEPNGHMTKEILLFANVCL